MLPPVVWVCGRMAAVTDDGPVWELQGVFSCEVRAVAECKDASYFVGPVQLDHSLPPDTTDWPGMYYPLGGGD